MWILEPVVKNTVLHTQNLQRRQICTVLVTKKSKNIITDKWWLHQLTCCNDYFTMYIHSLQHQELHLQYLQFSLQIHKWIHQKHLLFWLMHGIPIQCQKVHYSLSKIKLITVVNVSGSHYLQYSYLLISLLIRKHTAPIHYFYEDYPLHSVCTLQPKPVFSTQKFQCIIPCLWELYRVW